MTGILAVVLLVYALREVPRLIDRQQWRELAAFGCFTLLGCVLSLAVAMGVRLPYLATTVNHLVKALFGL